VTLRRRDEDEPFGTLSVSEIVKLFEKHCEAPKSKKRVDLEDRSFKI